MHFVLCGEQGSDFTYCEDVKILALAQKYIDQLEWDHREYIEFEIGFNMFAMNISSSYINKNFEVVSVENTSMAILTEKLFVDRQYLSQCLPRFYVCIRQLI